VAAGHSYGNNIVAANDECNDDRVLFVVFDNDDEHARQVHSIQTGPGFTRSKRKRR
jgi:hypothetical protein